MITPELIQRSIEDEFECLRCGHCCKGSGVVDIGEAEADRMAAHLGMKRRDFLDSYAVEAGEGRWWLKDQNNEERWCIFLEIDAEGLYGCRVNPAKPDQCASFPSGWRNPDSLRTCAGLRAMMRNLRERAKAAGPAAPGAA